MKKSKTTLVSLLLFCQNLPLTSQVYSQALGLRTVLHAPEHNLIELRDRNNFRLILKGTSICSHLNKGYSPVLNFYVENVEDVRKKIIEYGVKEDGGVVQVDIRAQGKESGGLERKSKGKIANFRGLEGEHISICDFQEEDQEEGQRNFGEEDKADKEIRNLLNKIKI